MPTSLQTMFAPQKDSPITVTIGEITPSDTSVVVQSAAILPQALPFPLTLGVDKGVTETVLVTAINGNQLTIQRGLYGQALSWIAGTKVARVLNAADISALQENISVVSQGLTAEQKRAQQAEQGLADSTAAEQSRAIGRENEIQALVEAETTRASGAESALSQAIATEKSRAVSAEGALGEGMQALASELATETKARQGADAELLGAITTEAGRAAGAEAGLAQAIAAEKSRAEGAEAAVQSNLDMHVGANLNAQAGIHGIRYYNDKLQRIAANGTDWLDIKAGTPAFVYECTGTDDDLAIQTIVNNFFANETAMSKKLIITGNMGLQASPSSEACINLDASNLRDAICFLDFSDCRVPNVTAPAKDFLGIGESARVSIVGLRVTATGCAVRIGGSSNNDFSNCTFIKSESDPSAGSVMIRGSNNTFYKCVFKGTLHNLFLFSGSNNRFDSCTLLDGMTVIATSNIFCCCNMAMISLFGMGTSLDVCFDKCRIDRLPVGEFFSGTITVEDCTVLNGITVDAADTDTEMKIINCRIKGTPHNIQQTSAANTVKWHLVGNAFSRANITIDGTTAITQKLSASVYMPQYANQFSRNIV